VAEYIPDRNLGYRYKIDTAFTLSNTAFTNRVQTNSYGFPFPNFEKKKPQGVFRIIIVGTSEETGFWSDGTYGYIQRLQDFLKNKNYPVEIINCSMDGWSRGMRNVNLIRNEYVHYDPDLILLMNEMPIVDEITYRKTYRQYLFVTPDTGRIDNFKEKIDHFITKKGGWIKLYDISYILRYYMKIYLDRILEHEHPFVKFTQKIFSQDVLNDIRLYARKNFVDWGPHMNVYFFDSSPDWDEEKVTWNTSPLTNRKITHLFSGGAKQNWAETDLTAYIKEKISEQSQYISLTLSSPYDGEENKHISFVSKKMQHLSPALHIKGYKEGKTTEFVFYPAEDGYVRSGTYSNNNFEVSDSIIYVGNNTSDSIKGLLKFDISNLNKIKRASLKLFISNLEVGNLYISRRYTLSETADTLKNLQTFLGERNIRFSVFDTYETPLQYAKSFERRGINYLYINVPSKEEYSFGKLDGHSTQAGHRAIAEAFFEALTNGVIPEQFLQPREGN
jgi:hypothetical protein